MQTDVPFQCFVVGEFRRSSFEKRRDVIGDRRALDSLGRKRPKRAALPESRESETCCEAVVRDRTLVRLEEGKACQDLW